MTNEPTNLLDVSFVRGLTAAAYVVRQRAEKNLALAKELNALAAQIQDLVPDDVPRHIIDNRITESAK